MNRRDPYPSGRFPTGRRIAVDDGIKARSTRGQIGTSWWSQRFLAILAAAGIGGRLERGRQYARAGQVLSLTVHPGVVTAKVQGSRPKPYLLTIGLTAFPDTYWAVVERALAGQALFSARLLAGEMPEEIEEVFREAGEPLFPTRAADISMECSCPDWGVPCKHLAATFYLLAEAFDEDPFQILLWRGRERDSLLTHLRELRAAQGGDDGGDAGDLFGESSTSPRKRAGKGTARGGKAAGTKAGGAGAAAGDLAEANGGVAAQPRIGTAAVLTGLPSAPIADAVDRFWSQPVPLPTRPPTLATDVDLLLRQLATPGPDAGGAELLARLREFYAAFRRPS